MSPFDSPCPKKGGPCRHCSIETVLRPFTRILKDARTGLFKPGERGLCRSVIGEFCNNDGRHFVRDLLSCPVPGALAVPLVPVEVSELDWARRRSV